MIGLSLPFLGRFRGAVVPIWELPSPVFSCQRAIYSPPRREARPRNTHSFASPGMFYRTGVNRDRTQDTEAGDKKRRDPGKQKRFLPLTALSALLVSRHLHQQKGRAVGSPLAFESAVAIGDTAARSAPAKRRIRPQALPASRSTQ